MADQYDVLATMTGEPTPEVDVNFDDSAELVRSAYLFESVKKDYGGPFARTAQRFLDEIAVLEKKSPPKK